MALNRNDVLLYAVTDRTWLRGRTLASLVEDALKGGATMIQLREKQLDDDAFEKEARQIKEICRGYQVPLLINDNVELAKRVGADGVHVGQNDAPADEVRRFLGKRSIIGVTAKTVEQALAAQAAGADYLGSGAVFGTETKADATPLPLDQFRLICESVSIPVVAIGGITAENICLLSGCKMSGFAIVHGIFGADDIEAETAKLKKLAEGLVSSYGH